MARNRLSDATDWIRLDLLFAVAGILFSMTVIPLYLWLSNLFIIGIPIAIGLASLLYLISPERDTAHVGGMLPEWAVRLFPSLTVLGMAGLIVLATLQGARSLWFYNVATVVAVLIFYQIVFTRERDFSVPVVLGQIVLLAFVLRFAALYTTTGYVGIDIWTHVPNWVVGILETDSLEPLDENKYYAAPWFHLLVAATARLGGLGAEDALNLSMGLVMALLVPLVYATARLLMDARWSTFAAAGFAIVGYSMEWSIHLIPTSLGLAFFAGSFYLLCRIMYYRFDGAEFLLLVLFNVAVVLTHQVATFITLVLLVSCVITIMVLPGGLFSSVAGGRSRPSANRESANLLGLTIFDLGFVTFMWSMTPFHGQTFLETTWIFFQNTLTESEGFGDLVGERTAEDAPPIETSTLAQVIDVIDASVFIVLFFLTTVGVLAVLHRDRLSYPTFMMGTSIVAMCVFVFGFPMFGIRTFIPTRWYAFMAIPMFILAALGAAYIRRNTTPTMAVAILLCFILVFPTAAMMSSSATLDSPRFESEQTRYSYTAAEFAVLDTVAEEFPVTDEEDPTEVHTDHPYWTTFDRTEAHPSVRLELSESGLAEADIIIYRDYAEYGAAYFEDAYNRTYSPSVTPDMVCPPDRSTVYYNGDVRICR